MEIEKANGTIKIHAPATEDLRALFHLHDIGARWTGTEWEVATDDAKTVVRILKDNYGVPDTPVNVVKYKWSQWSQRYGIIASGEAGYEQLMEWMESLRGKAKEIIKGQDRRHVVYGRERYKDQNKTELLEVRFYLDVFMDDKELQDVLTKCPYDVFHITDKEQGDNNDDV